MKRVHVVSGRVECPDSLHMAACLNRFFRDDGCTFVDSREEADVVVLNGCERIVETPDFVRDYDAYARKHPTKQVLVVGCVQQGAVGATPPANFHLVPFRKLVREPSLIGPSMGFSGTFSLLKKDDIFNGRYPLEETYPGNPPATEICLLTIGSGCRGGCSFCTIQRGRGSYRSLPLEETLSDARTAMAAGRFRFVLLADDAGCWGQDLGLDLPYLLGELSKVCPTARFLIRPLNPAHLPGMFASLEPYLERIDYLYLPLQSASNRVLGLMNRGYTAEPILELLRGIRKNQPWITLKTDIIVGFPGETREEFRQSIAAAEVFHEASFHRCVVYPGTPAARLPGRLDDEELRLRMDVVRRLGYIVVDPSTYSYETDVESLMKVAAPHKKVHVVTGNSDCINNTYLALCLERYFDSQSHVFVDDESEADVLVLNVCNVLVETPDLIEKYRGVARGALHKHVLVLGCVPGGVQLAPEETNFHVIPYGQLVREPGLIGSKMGFSAPFSLLKADAVFSRALPFGRVPFPPDECCFITIGSGCEGRCTYCSIKSGRGEARSLAPDEIVADAKAGVAAGRFRLVLIADDAGCWGHDLGLTLPDLLRQITDACPTARFVILDFNPRNLPVIFDRLTPFLDRIDYLYMPLQSGSDRILRLMDRQYSASEILDLLRQIRTLHPSLLLETDIIVGFPSETREEFEASVAAARVFGSAAFVPYVPKLDTPAARLPQRISAEELRARIAIVERDAQGQRFKAIETSMSGRAHGGVGKVRLVVEATRNGPVLERPTQACLTKYSAINLTANCSLECPFCDEEVASNAGPRSVHLYANTLEALERELDVKVPELVCLSPICEPFAPEKSVLKVLFGVVTLLLERGVFLLVETRTQVPEAFVSLFAQYPDRVKVQVGLATVDERVRELLEPNASTVAARLATMKDLVDRGIPTEVGVGPIMPELADSELDITALCASVARTGVTRGSVSYVDAVSHDAAAVHGSPCRARPAAEDSACSVQWRAGSSVEVASGDRAA